MDSYKKGQSLINFLLPSTKSICTQSQPAWLHLCFRIDKLAISFSPSPSCDSCAQARTFQIHLPTTKMASGNGCQSTKKKNMGRLRKMLVLKFLPLLTNNWPVHHLTIFYLPTLYFCGLLMEKIKHVLLLPAHFINKVALGFSKPMVCRFGLLLFVCLPYM